MYEEKKNELLLAQDSLDELTTETVRENMWNELLRGIMRKRNGTFLSSLNSRLFQKSKIHRMFPFQCEELARFTITFSFFFGKKCHPFRLGLAMEQKGTFQMQFFLSQSNRPKCYLSMWDYIKDYEARIVTNINLGDGLHFELNLIRDCAFSLFFFYISVFAVWNLPNANRNNAMQSARIRISISVKHGNGTSE